MTAGDAPSLADADPVTRRAPDRDGGSSALTVGYDRQRLISESRRGTCRRSSGRGWTRRTNPGFGSGRGSLIP
eukprot:953764-Pleurochrysis_carterae.AAC.1